MASYTSAFPDDARLPLKHLEVAKSLRRLARETLIALALEWLKPANQAMCAPVLDPLAQEALDPAMTSGPLPTLSQVQRRFEGAGGLKDSKKEILDAISTHWSAGLSLRQWAMVDEARLSDEMATPTASSGMQWVQFKAERPLVDYGPTLDGYRAPDITKGLLLRIKPALLIQNLQHRLGSLIKTHVHFIQPGGSHSVLRIVCFPEDTAYSQDNTLSNCDNVKVLFIAFQNVGSSIHVSPSSTRIDGDDPSSLVLQAISRLLSTESAPLHLEKVVSGTAGPLSCHALFQNSPVNAFKQQDQTETSETAAKQPTKTRTKKDKIDPETRKKILELRAQLRFQGPAASEESE